MSKTEVADRPLIAKAFVVTIIADFAARIKAILNTFAPAVIINYNSAIESETPSPDPRQMPLSKQ